jgi:hypothetical protein
MSETKNNRLMELDKNTKSDWRVKQKQFKDKVTHAYMCVCVGVCFVRPPRSEIRNELNQKQNTIL